MTRPIQRTDLFKAEFYFLIGFGLVNLLTFTLLLSSLTFAAGLSLSWWQFPLAFIFSMITGYVASGYVASGNAVSGFGENRLALFLKTALLVGVLTVVAILLATRFYDLSFDGQWYHQETVYALKTGWNPFYGEIHPEGAPVIRSMAVWCETGGGSPAESAIANMPAIANADTVNLKLLQINHFVKGAEIPEAAIYGLVNRIESGKATNGILLAASFFLCLSFLHRIERISRVKKWLLAILVSFNPIVITQLETFCVDGQIASLILCMIVVFCLLYTGAGLQHPGPDRSYLFLLASVILLMVNVKFTGLLFSFVLCAGFLAVLLMNKKVFTFKRSMAVCFFSALGGVFLVGFHPYISNQIRDHSPLYGIAHVRRSIDEITPDLYRYANSFEELFLSLAGHTDDHSEDRGSVRAALKIPFTFNKADLASANNPQVKVAGFGPFFSGILLLSFALLIIYALRKGDRPAKRNTLLAIVAINASVIAVSAAWWARFTPQFWLVPFVILFAAELYPVKNTRILRSCLYGAALFNIAWALSGIFFNLLISERIDYQMAQMKSVHRTIGVQYCSYRSYKSNGIRLSENHIPYEERPLQGKYLYNIIHSSTVIQVPEELPELRKPLFLRWLDRFKGS